MLQNWQNLPGRLQLNKQLICLTCVLFCGELNSSYLFCCIIRTKYKKNRRKSCFFEKKLWNIFAGSWQPAAFVGAVPRVPRAGAPCSPSKHYVLDRFACRDSSIYYNFSWKKQRLLASSDRKAVSLYVSMQLFVNHCFPSPNFASAFVSLIRYLKEFRVEQCPLFLQHKCTQHRPFTCFHWHFMNQRRRRPKKKRDGVFNYNPDVYCTQ